jgi:hypothetical protein
VSDSESGERGPAGERGVTGRQGEAGVSGRQGEAGNTGSTGETGEAGERGKAGAVGGRGRTGRGLSNTQMTVIFLFVVLAFVVVAGRTEVQQRQINRNAHRIEVTQYEICTTRNAATRRQNALIDAAIEAEKRKPHPDAKRIRDLENFKGATPSCGPKPVD